jgi:hypothetical protein
MRASAVVTAHSALRDGFLRPDVGHEPVADRIWTRIAAAPPAPNCSPQAVDD